MRGIGQVTARMGIALRGFFHPAAGRAIEWDQKHLPDLLPHAELVDDRDRSRQLDRVLERFLERALPALPSLRAQVIHNDITLDNLLLDDARRGVGDHRLRRHDTHGAGARRAGQPAVAASATERTSSRWPPISCPATRRCCRSSAARPNCWPTCSAGRMAQTILISAWRTRQFPDNAYITGWAEPAWALLDQLERVGMDRAAERLAGYALAPVSRGRSAAPPADDELRERRQQVLGSALESLSYARPLHLVRGSGAWMYDADGDAYLDAYNNVPVVGHAHPRVTDAIARQAALLNTNTRYLHDAIVELAERIVASMPDGLDTVMFVNSGSEANDLAWRLATIGHRRRCRPRHRLGVSRRDRRDRRLLAIGVAARRAAGRRRDLPGARHLSRALRRREATACQLWRGRTWMRRWPASPSVGGGRPPCSWTPSSPRPASSRRIRRSWPRRCRRRGMPARCWWPTRCSRAMVAPATGCGASRPGG